MLCSNGSSSSSLQSNVTVTLPSLTPVTTHDVPLLVIVAYVSSDTDHTGFVIVALLGSTFNVKVIVFSTSTNVAPSILIDLITTVSPVSIVIIFSISGVIVYTPFTGVIGVPLNKTLFTYYPPGTVIPNVSSTPTVNSSFKL